MFSCSSCVCDHYISIFSAALPRTTPRTRAPPAVKTTPFMTTPAIGVDPPQYAVIRPPQASVPVGSAVQLECNAIGKLPSTCALTT